MSGAGNASGIRRIWVFAISEIALGTVIRDMLNQTYY